MSAQYRALQDCFLDGVYVNAGDTVTFNGIPGPYLDPLTPDAVANFYAAGPAAPVLARTQWSTQFVAPPATCWVASALPAAPGASGQMKWSLTGLGSALPPIIV